MSGQSLVDPLVPRWYRVGLLMAVAAIPAYRLRFSVGGIPTNLFEVTVAILVVAGLVTPAIRRQWRVSERQLPRPALLVIGCFIVAALISAIVSDVPRISFGIFKSWVVIPILLGWIVYAQAGKFRIKQALIFSGCIVALLSLTQFKWGERLSGIYDVPNSLALYLAPLIVLTVLTARRKFWRLFAAVVMFLALLLTQSAAGIFVTLAVLSVASVMSLKHNIQSTKTKQNTIQNTQKWALLGICLPAIALATAGVLSFVFFASTGRLAYLASPWTRSEPNSISVRLQLWSVSWDLIKEHPLLGIGLGQFEPAYQQKLHERFTNSEFRIQNLEAGSRPLREFVFRDPHNWLLSFWLNTGLVGLLSFAGLHLWLFWRATKFKSITYTLSPTMLALLTLLLFGLVDTIYWKNDLAALHWVLLAQILGRSTRNIQ